MIVQCRGFGFFSLVLVSALRFDSCLRFLTLTLLWFSSTATFTILVGEMRHKVDRKDFLWGWGWKGGKRRGLKNPNIEIRH